MRVCTSLTRPQRQLCWGTAGHKVALQRGVALPREWCMTPRSHPRARVTRLMLHYCDGAPYAESGAAVMYGPLLLPNVWLSWVTRTRNPDLRPDNWTFLTSTMSSKWFLKEEWSCYLSPWLLLRCNVMILLFYRPPTHLVCCRWKCFLCFGVQAVPSI